MKHRIGRINGTPYAIAAGFAYGAAVSCTPFIGLHIILSAACSWLTRASIVAAAIGTVVGNPWTFPFIWVWIYTLGVWILGLEPIELDIQLLSLGYLYNHFWDIFLPMIVGGFPTALVCWPIFYFPIRSMVERYQRNRRR